jgi:peptidoglycan biosynthesis protein MviN/MurJ (putative lipid II flippase)
MRTQLAVVSILTVASQLAALFKLWFTARIFGVGAELDGYNLSIVLPTLIAGVMAGVLQTGLFPVRARLNANGDEAATASFERSVLLGMATLGSLFTLLLLLGAPFIVDKLSSSAPESVRASLAFAFPVIVLLVALNFIGDCCGYLLAMRNRFAIAAVAPVVNGLLGAFMLAVWPEGGLTNLIAGTVLGVALQVTICLWGLKSTGFVFIGPLPSWVTTQKHWGEMLSLGGWILPGVIFSNLVVSLPPIWAAQYGEGAVSAFGYAYRLHSSALQLLVIASSTVILAQFSNLEAQGDVAAVRRILVKAGVVSAIVGLFGVLAVWAVGAVLLHWLFGGRFDHDVAARVASHWLLLTIGLPFAILGNVFAKLWQAQRRPQLISIMAAISLMSLTVIHSTVDIFLKEYSLPAALAASAASVVLAGMWFLNPSKNKLPVSMKD